MRLSFHPPNFVGQPMNTLRQFLKTFLSLISCAKEPRDPRESTRSGNEAFANVYVEITRAVEAEVGGQPIPPDCDFPTVNDGVDGMAFIATAVKSAKAGGVWTRMIELRKS